MRPDLVACWPFRVNNAGEPELLLIHRAPGRTYPGLWQCVTGRLEEGESIIAGALREVLEETQLGQNAIEALFETDIVNFFHEASVDGIWSEVVFAARVRYAAEVSVSEEHDDARWLSPSAAHELVIWPAYHRAIDHVVWLVANTAKAATYRVAVNTPTS